MRLLGWEQQGLDLPWLPGPSPQPGPSPPQERERAFPAQAPLEPPGNTETAGWGGTATKGVLVGAA